jgi:hypothetical protein
MATTVKFPIIPNKPPLEFKFTVPTTLDLEEAAGMSIDMMRLRGQNLKALVLLTCYGLKWDDPSMTELRAKKILGRFVDAGGDVVELTKALVDALNVSGVYGRPESTVMAESEAAEIAEGEEDADAGDDPQPRPS